MPLKDVDFYILVNGPDIKKVSGKPFTIGDPPMLFYYQSIKNKEGKNRFVVTIPESGIKLCSGNKLKDCKEYILENLEVINKEMASDKYKELEATFQQLKNNIIEKEG